MSPVSAHTDIQCINGCVVLGNSVFLTSVGDSENSHIILIPYRNSWDFYPLKIKIMNEKASHIPNLEELLRDASLVLLK